MRSNAAVLALLVGLAACPTVQSIDNARAQAGLLPLVDMQWRDASGMLHTGLDGSGVAVFSHEGFDPTHRDLDQCRDPDRFALLAAPGGSAPPIGPVSVPRNDAGAHGDFIAGILCGDGAQSGGRFRGVAPASVLFAWTGLCIEGCDLSSWFLDERLHIYTTSVDDDGYDTASRLGMPDGVDLLFLESAGNGGGDGSTATTQAMRKAPWSLGIAASDASGTGVASYSSRGDRANSATWPDLTAPGCMVGVVPLPWLDFFATSASNDVQAVAAGSQDCRRLGTGEAAELAVAGYALHSGTSFATPLVAGIAALMFQVHPGLNASAAGRLLTQTATPFLASEDTNGDGRVSADEFWLQHGFEAGYGLVNATAAVAAAHYLSIHEGATVDEALSCFSVAWPAGSAAVLNPEGAGCGSRSAVERGQESRQESASSGLGLFLVGVAFALARRRAVDG